MREPFNTITGRVVRAIFQGFLPKLATSALTTLVVSALFAQLAPERPVAAPPTVAPDPAAVPVERLWPREADLARVFSFSLDTASQPFSEFTPAHAAAPVLASETGALAAPSKPASGAPGRGAAAKVASPKPRTASGAVAAAPMLPPARPATIHTSAPIAVVAESAAAPESKPVRLLGMTLPGWVPTGESVVNTVTALGGAVRDRLSF